MDRVSKKEYSRRLLWQKQGVPSIVKLGQIWHISDQLGVGGFAKVYLAHDREGGYGGNQLIPKASGAQRELLFVDLDGVPNVMPILDSGESDDYWALVMPRAEKSLRDYLTERGGLLPVNDAVSVLVEIAEDACSGGKTLSCIETSSRGISCCWTGHWGISLTLGIARYAEATTAPDTFKYAMTRPYAAPEQWRGERASSATDVVCPRRSSLRDANRTATLSRTRLQTPSTLRSARDNHRHP